MLRARLAALFLGAVFACAAVAHAAADDSKVLRFIPGSDLVTIDPHWTGAYVTRNYGYLVYDTLFGLDHDFHPQPQMVETWTASADDLTWEFRLRDHLAFHDGQPVRAADVVASLKRWGQRNDVYGQALLAAAASIEALDERRFRIVLKTYFPVIDALATLTTPTPFILPKRIAQTDAFTQITDPTGSGPFKMVMAEWQAGHKVVFARNADYVPRPEPSDGTVGGKITKVDRVEWLYIPDPNTARQALVDGEVDYWENVQNDFVPDLARDPDLKVVDYPGSIGVLRFNWLLPPFNDVRMRQAVLGVVNQSDYMAAVAGDQANWRTCYSVYLCRAEEIETRGSEALAGPRDYDKAKKLIAEAGYKGERIVLLDTADIPQLHAMALVSADMLKRLGLNVDIVTSEWGTVIKRLNLQQSADQGGWNVFVTGYAAHDFINPATNRNLRAGGLNGAPPGWASDDKLEALRAAWFQARDDASRRELAAEIQERAFEVVPFIPLGQYRNHGAYRTALTGRVDAPMAVLWNIEKAK
jgi:peptide/nickel transport system substrate-binding protein